MSSGNTQLQANLQSKKRELEKVGNKLAGAGVGAMIARSTAIGSAAGAMMGRQKNERARLEREIADIERQIQANTQKIAQLNSEKSRLENTYAANKTRAETAAHQQQNQLAMRKQNTQDPAEQRQIDAELSKSVSQSNAQAQADYRAHDLAIDRIDREIAALTQ